jgi:hypothetical protein
MQAARSDNLLIQEYFFEEIPVLRCRWNGRNFLPTATAPPDAASAGNYRRLELFVSAFAGNPCSPPYRNPSGSRWRKAVPSSPARAFLALHGDACRSERFQPVLDLSLTGNNRRRKSAFACRHLEPFHSYPGFHGFAFSAGL